MGMYTTYYISLYPFSLYYIKLENAALPALRVSAAPVAADDGVLLVAEHGHGQLLLLVCLVLLVNPQRVISAYV